MASDPCGRNPRSLRIRRACRPVIHRYVPMSQDIAHWLETDVGVESGRIRQAYDAEGRIAFDTSTSLRGALQRVVAWISEHYEARGNGG